jgi:hypothetical protein
VASTPRHVVMRLAPLLVFAYDNRGTIYMSSLVEGASRWVDLPALVLEIDFDLRDPIDSTQSLQSLPCLQTHQRHARFYGVRACTHTPDAIATAPVGSQSRRPSST